MSRIPQAFIDDLIQRLDILEVVDARVKLKRAGKNYSACCPFHTEKTPSFTVSPDKQFYYCFGCGASGTSLGFIMEYDRLSFTEAIESAAKSLGLSVPREDQGVKAPPANSHLYGVLDQAKKFYQAQLRAHPEHKSAVNYLKQRGLTGEVCMLFGLGYAPSGWDTLIQQFAATQTPLKTLQDAGLVVVSEDAPAKRYDRFRQRIMFPILDVRGRTIGFGGRIFGSDTTQGVEGKKTKSLGPKYLNSPETAVFHKGKELYGLFQARQQNRQLTRLLVVEGYMDVIALAQFEITYAVATLGTACGEDHLRLAFKYCSEIVFCFDGDKAGRTAAKRALEHALGCMEDGRQIKFLFLPEGQDPDTLVRQIGKARFEQQIEQAQPLEDYFFRLMSEDINPRSLEGRARISKLAAPYLHRLPEGVFRTLMFEKLASYTGLSLATLQSLMQAPAQPLVAEPVAEPAAPIMAAMPVASAPAAPDFQPAQPKAPQLNLRTPVKLNPARLAFLLLLEFPQLIEQPIDMAWPHQLDDPDQQRLAQLIALIQQHHLRSFHSIAGFWGGLYGMEAQQQLTDLAASQFVNTVTRTAPFNAAQELADAFARLRQAAQLREIDTQLQQLQALDYTQLTPEQKQQWLALLLAKSHNQQKKH